MGVIDTTFRTITCNGTVKNAETGEVTACPHTITYEVAKEKETFEAAENVWMKSLRAVQSLDNRRFNYCSDLCEATGVEAGLHNLPEQKRIISNVATPAQIEAAAAAARNAEKATAAIKQGAGVSLS
jgi:hypothetical protein